MSETAISDIANIAALLQNLGIGIGWMYNFMMYNFMMYNFMMVNFIMVNVMTVNFMTVNFMTANFQPMPMPRLWGGARRGCSGGYRGRGWSRMVMRSY